MQEEQKQRKRINKREYIKIKIDEQGTGESMRDGERKNNNIAVLFYDEHYRTILTLPPPCPLPPPCRNR